MYIATCGYGMPSFFFYATILVMRNEPIIKLYLLHMNYSQVMLWSTSTITAILVVLIHGLFQM